MGSHLSLIHTGGGMTEAPIKRLFFLFYSFNHICDLCGYLQNKLWQIIILMYLLYVQYASRIVHTVQQMWHKRRCSDVIPSGCTLGGTHTRPQCDHRSWAHLFVPLCICVNAHTHGRVCSANMPLAVVCDLKSNPRSSRSAAALLAYVSAHAWQLNQYACHLLTSLVCCWCRFPFQELFARLTATGIVPAR